MLEVICIMCNMHNAWAFCILINFRVICTLPKLWALCIMLKCENLRASTHPLCRKNLTKSGSESELSKKW